MHGRSTESVEPATGHNADYEFVAELQLLMKLGLAEKDEIVCRIGEMAQELFVLKAGEVQIFHPPSALAGRIAPLAVLKQPNAKGIAPSFGEECIQARDRYEFTVRAMCECVLYLIDKRGAFP